jgi:hypothetical protein
MSFAGEPMPTTIEVRQWIEQARAKVSTRSPASPQPSIAHATPSVGGPGAHASMHNQPATTSRVEAQSEIFVHDARRVLRPPADAEIDPIDSPTGSRRHSHILENVRMSDRDAPDDVTAAQRSAGVSADLASFIAPAAVKLPPKVVVELEPKAGSQAAGGGAPGIVEPDEAGRPVPLAKFVAGLSPLPVRAPGHERIEIAVDDAGVLHLLARDNLLRELPVAERWAHAHRELIAMACPQHRIDPAGRTLCHVFASEPIKVADLHASNLRLHVLAAVSVGDRTAWYAAPLNAAP